MKGEYFCKIYKDYKISIPLDIRKLLAIKPNENMVFRVTKGKQVIISTASNELYDIQKDLKHHFKNKPIVDDFLAKRGHDYDD
ncbi:MAG: hypothetical protein A3F18_05060 [Legionellales bacterium RIFCSPHIGHO2_12_FULL_37_14]|nr:MAG: hypothetical protein A3F18_05060 [Legionellales bacterium RIFCSPHIGHO2_12_FULL_37_14]